MLRSIRLCTSAAIIMLSSCGSDERISEPYTQAQIDDIQKEVQTEGLCESVEDVMPSGWTAETVKISVRCVNYGHPQDYSVTKWSNGSISVKRVQS